MKEIQKMVMLLLNIDTYGTLDKNGAIKFENILNDDENLKLLREYFYEEEYIEELIIELDKIAKYTKDNYYKAIANIVGMYPFSKKLLEHLKITNFSASTALLSAIDKYLDNIRLVLKETDEMKNLKKITENLKNLNNDIIKLEVEINELENKSKKEKLALQKKESLEQRKKELIDLLENNKIEYVNEGLENEIEKINSQIRAVADILKIKREERENLLKHLSELSLEKLEKEENILIRQLSDLWCKKDIEVSYE